MREKRGVCYLALAQGKHFLLLFLYLAIDGKAFNRVSEYKYLGVVLDASLTWNAHVDYYRHD